MSINSTNSGVSVGSELPSSSWKRLRARFDIRLANRIMLCYVPTLHISSKGRRRVMGHMGSWERSMEQAGMMAMRIIGWYELYRIYPQPCPNVSGWSYNYDLCRNFL